MKQYTFDSGPEIWIYIFCCLYGVFFEFDGLMVSLMVWLSALFCSHNLCFCRAAGWRWHSHKYFFPPVQTAIWCGPHICEHVHGERWAPDCQGSQSVLVYNFCAFQLKHIKPRFIWTVFFAPLYFTCCNLNINWLTNRVRWSLATSSVRGKDWGKVFFF